ncbi:MAG: hypothetical protein ACKO5E_08840, partial [bacterium]
MPGRLTFFKKLFSSYVSARAMRRGEVTRKQKHFLKEALLDLLEERQLLASYSASGTELIIRLDVPNQNLTVTSLGLSYLFTLSPSSSNWTGTGIASVSGATLTANVASLATYSTFTILRSANNTGVNFANSGANSYSDNFNVSIANATAPGMSGCITFTGNTTFSGGNNFSIVTDRSVTMSANSSLTMNNGSLLMNINTQATPKVFANSGLTVNNATIQTLGNGQTTIAARGGIGPCSTYQNKGVAVVNGGRIIGGTTGTISITGYGYNNLSGGVVQGQGVLVYSTNTTATSTISSLGANVVVTGYGANETNANLSSIPSGPHITNAGVVV